MSDGPHRGPGGDRPDDSQWRPVDPPYEYPPSEYPPAYPPTSQLPPDYSPGYPPTQPPGHPTGYPPIEPPGYPPAQPPGQPEPTRRSTRTVWLVVAVVVLLVVLIGALGYAVSTSGDDDEQQTAVPTTTQALPPIPSVPDLPGTDPSESDLPSSATPGPGQVLYSLSGNGQVLGFTWSVGRSFRVMPRLIRPPFSVAADVTGTPSLTALILSGQITCTITRDGVTLATSSSSTGILRCTAPAG